MDWMRIFLVAGPMFLGLAVALGVLTLARAARLRGRRSPLTQGLLRGPGHALRERLDDIHLDLMGWLMGCLMMPALLGSLYLSGPQVRSDTVATVNASVYLVTGAGILLFCTYRLVALMRRSIDYRSGLDAEVAAGQELDQLMRQGAWVFHDLPASGFNIDHVLVCASGVYAIETKSRFKPVGGERDAYKVTFDGEKLQFPTWNETEPVEQARRQAKWLGDELSKSVGEPTQCAAVLALPGWYITVTRRSDVRVLNPKNFRFLLEQKTNGLSSALIDRIAYQLEQKCRNVSPAFKGAAHGNNP
jgi:hypothetical protein